MIALHRYHLLEDAWQGGVEDWCRAASSHVLGGGRAWMLALSDGHANWIKRRLLRAGISLFGVQFLDVRGLRQELRARAGFTPPAFGRESLELLLRSKALQTIDQEEKAVAVARHPGACLTALDDLTASGWLDDCDQLTDILSPSLCDWLPALDRTGSWSQQIDRDLAKHFDPRQAQHRKKTAAAPTVPPPPLSVCFFGWDATRWPLLNVLLAAIRAAESAYLFLPLPRGTAENIQQAWLDALAEMLTEEFEDCPSSDFQSAQGALTTSLEGTDFGAYGGPPPLPPELLVGADRADVVNLVCDCTARWLLERSPKAPAGREAAAGENGDTRLVILSPSRNATSVAVVRALGAAGIAVEDELGELPEPALVVQVHKAILSYLLNDAGMDQLLALVELLNEYAAARVSDGHDLLERLFPLDPVEVRRAMHGAFSDVQHHSARVLCRGSAFTRTKVAGSLCELISHLDQWPEKVSWRDALRRWERCLTGLGLDTSIPSDWPTLESLPLEGMIPAVTFWQYLEGLLGTSLARRLPEGAHRFARVVVTNLESAVGQVWGGVLFLDSLEGDWPLYPAENPFLDDSERVRLNTRRAENSLDGDGHARAHLLTSSELAQLEHFRFLEVLENCTGPLIFAGAARDPDEPNKELYPNEWVLRCLVESRRDTHDEDKGRLLDSWRQAIQTVRLSPHRLAKAEKTHLQTVFHNRREENLPFDDYFFNFSALTTGDELPFAEAWSARDLDAAWNRPATFAMSQIYGADPWHGANGGSPTRKEDATVGRLVHQWVARALDAASEPRRFTADDWRRALSGGLAAAQHNTETGLRGALGLEDASGTELPYWWLGALRKARWAAERCLETLAETAHVFAAGKDGQAGDDEESSWLCLGKKFEGEVSTHDGPLRLRAHCDVLLLDRENLAGAACQFVDLRTGGQSGVAAPTIANLEKGQGLKLIGLLFLALAEGASPDGIQVGVVHPDGSNRSLLDAETAAALQPTVEALARKQRFLVFGQRGGLVEGFGHDQAENLPLATTPIPPDILTHKASLDDQTTGTTRPTAAK